LIRLHSAYCKVQRRANISKAGINTHTLQKERKNIILERENEEEEEANKTKQINNSSS
jgi:hypothetical protein